MKWKQLAGAVALAFGFSAGSSAAVIVAEYGDDDGFGVGETAGNISNANTSHAGPGEAAFTDIRLIGDPFPGLPAFEPTGGFSFVVPAGHVIVSALLTLRTGSWDSGPSPVDGGGTNALVLDGMTVDPAFLAGFTSARTQIIETRSIALDASFFAALADGSVSLLGTNLSEDSGSGSFQVDFLRLTIETQSGQAPVPATLGLLGAGLFALGMARRRKSR